jgi:hypothetical protein
MYIGKTRRTFNIRLKEHIDVIRNNNSNSGYSNHVLNAGHTYGTIADNMDITKRGKKVKLLNVLEKYHIYRINKENLLMNDNIYIQPHI